jgi:acetyltransferase-like isoleucine patch superfamily enzyme
MYGTVCTIDTDVFIKNKNNFTSGQGSCLYHSCYILNTNGKFVIGNNSHLGALCYVNVCYGSVTIGDDVAVGPGTKIFAYSNHYRRGGKVTDEKIIKEVIIGNNVLVGANCTILPGTIINDNIIIGAGSIVKGELETNSIYAGIPCKKIKSGWYE